MNEEFWVKQPKIYVFVDVLKKVKRSAYASMNSVSQQERRYERGKRVRGFCILRLFKIAHSYIITNKMLNKVCHRYGPRTELFLHCCYF